MARQAQRQMTDMEAQLEVRHLHGSLKLRPDQHEPEAESRPPRYQVLAYLGGEASCGDVGYQGGRGGDKDKDGARVLLASRMADGASAASAATNREQFALKCLRRDRLLRVHGGRRRRQRVVNECTAMLKLGMSPFVVKLYEVRRLLPVSPSRACRTRSFRPTNVFLHLFGPDVFVSCAAGV